jgi:hypothetical protein
MGLSGVAPLSVLTCHCQEASSKPCLLRQICATVTFVGCDVMKHPRLRRVWPDCLYQEVHAANQHTVSIITIHASSHIGDRKRCRYPEYEPLFERLVNTIPPIPTSSYWSCKSGARCLYSTLRILTEHTLKFVGCPLDWLNSRCKAAVLVTLNGAQLFDTTTSPISVVCNMFAVKE